MKGRLTTQNIYDNNLYPTAPQGSNVKQNAGAVMQNAVSAKLLAYTESLGNFTPFAKYKDPHDPSKESHPTISFGQHKRDTSVLYLMKISDKKFKEAILPQLQKAGIAK